MVTRKIIMIAHRCIKPVRFMVWSSFYVSLCTETGVSLQERHVTSINGLA